MSVEKQSYLSCNGCGRGCYLDGYNIYGETDDCVRDQAEDECGWAVRVGKSANEDYCRECREKFEEEGTRRVNVNE